MKRKVFLIGLVFLISILSWNWAQNEKFPVLKGEYLGQKPPGTTPEIFAPGIVSTTQVAMTSVRWFLPMESIYSLRNEEIFTGFVSKLF